MDQQIQISIIIPSFNQAQYLEQTILSIINQNIENIEIIVMDGGSTDGSVDIIKKYSDKLAYWVSEPDRGQSHAINKGFARAKGDIIAWLNSDDLYLPNTLSTVLERFKSNPDVDLIYGDVINFDETEKEQYYKVAEFEPYDFLSRVSIHQPAVFWRKHVFEKIGFLDETLHYVMDYDYWMRIFFRFNTLKIDKPLAKFRVHSASKTSSNPPKMYLEWRKVLSRFFQSVADAQELKIFETLKILDNPNNISFEIKNRDFCIKKAMNLYIFQVAVQEYSFGSRKKCNTLLFHSIFHGHFFRGVRFLITNNILKLFR